MNLENKKVVELKKICIEKKLKGYSKLNKEELVQLLSKKDKKKQKGGYNQNIYNRIIEQSSIKKLIDGKKSYLFDSYKNVDLSNAILIGTNLTDADLTNANLKDADLTDAILIDANLTNANLTNANLIGTNLKDADLTDAILINISFYDANLSNAIMIRAKLIDACMCIANLTGTDLTDADLTDADLSDSILTNAILTDAILTGADLTNAILTDAILTGTDLTDADLTNANLTNAIMIRAKLIDACMCIANLTGTDLTDADLTDADLSDSILTNAILTDAILTGTDLTDADLTNANLTNANLTNANLTNANLTNANLTNANLTNANLTNAFRNNEDFNINSTILIKSNMLKKNNNKSSKELYNFILTLNNTDLVNKRFVFEDQSGINAGGLSRIVYDLFYTKYMKTFFEENDDMTSTFIIKSNINTDEFNNATNKLIILAKESEVKIYIKINDLLLSILKSDNIIDSINLSKLSNYNSEDRLSNEKRKSLLGNESKISNVIISSKNNTKFSKNMSNIENNHEKKEIYLRRFLSLQKFKTFEQAENMHNWIKKFWNDELFINKISFTLGDFIKRIIIIDLKGGNGNTRKEYKFNNLNNRDISNLIKIYPNLGPIINYIKKGEEQCKYFSGWITGSLYSIKDIKIMLHNNEYYKNLENRWIIYAPHTCDNTLDIYKTHTNNRNNIGSNVVNNNTLYVQIKSEVDNPFIQN